MSVNNSNNDVLTSLFDDLIRIKKQAIKTDDYSFYKEILEMLREELSKAYAKAEGEGVKFFEEFLKLVSCELKGIMIKYKKSKVPF